MENYAVINGTTYELSDKIVGYLKDKIEYEEINMKKYNIGRVTIAPNCIEGYDYFDKVNNKKGNILGISTHDDDEEYYIYIRKEELSGIIEALTEINNFLIRHEEFLDE